MKKSLLALVAFAFIGALAFAEDAKTAAPALTFSGAFKTGVQVNDNIGEKATTKLLSEDVGTVPYRFDLIGNYAFDQNAGFSFKLRQDGMKTYTNLKKSAKGDDASTRAYIPTVKYAYAYANLLNNFVYVSGGYIDDGIFGTSGDDGYSLTLDQAWNDVAGLEIAIKPFPGLAIGGLYVANTTTTGGLYNDKSTNADFDVGSGIAVAYTLDKAFGVEGAVLFSESKLDSWYVGAQYLADAALTLAIETKTNYTETSKDLWVREIDEVLAYNVDKINFGLTAYQYFFGSDVRFTTSVGSFDQHAQANFKLNPWVSYDFDKTYTGKLDFIYYNAAGDTADNGLAYTSYYGDIKDGNVNANFAIFKVKPSLIINVNSKATLKLADAVAWNAGDKSAFQAYYGGTKNAVNNSLYADFIYKF